MHWSWVRIFQSYESVQFWRRGLIPQSWIFEVLLFQVSSQYTRCVHPKASNYLSIIKLFARFLVRKLFWLGSTISGIISIYPSVYLFRLEVISPRKMNLFAYFSIKWILGFQCVSGTPESISHSSSGIFWWILTGMSLSFLSTTFVWNPEANYVRKVPGKFNISRGLNWILVLNRVFCPLKGSYLLAGNSKLSGADF